MNIFGIIKNHHKYFSSSPKNYSRICQCLLTESPAVIWLKHCRYGVKPYTTNRGIREEEIYRQQTDRFREILFLCNGTRGRVNISVVCFRRLRRNMHRFFKVINSRVKLNTPNKRIQVLIGTCALE